jgi:hypothetical protein
MTYPFARWERATECTGGPTSGAAALLAWCQANRPSGERSMGIYNCRNVRGSTTTSLHGEGRALDWGVPLSAEETGTPEGRALVDLLGTNADTLGLQAVIYDRTIWSARSPAGRPYNGVSPHYDHLHIELTWEAARNLTLATAVAVLGGTAEKPIRVEEALVYNQKQDFSDDEIRLIENVVGTLADGLWDVDTVSAIAHWQRSHDIPPDGKVWRNARGNTWPRIQAAAAGG